MNPWIVRGLLALIALEAGICVTFLADDWKPLHSQETALFKSALQTARQGVDYVIDTDRRQLTATPQPRNRTRLVRPLEPGSEQPIVHVPLDEDSRSVLETLPPSPSRWHLLLKHMHEVGCRVAAVETPLSWKGDDLYHLARLRTLDRSLALFDLAVLTVDLQRLPEQRPAAPIPEYLRHTAIPIRNVRGELGALVRVNHVRQPPSASTAPHIRFAFRSQESVEGVDPAIVRWGDYLIPSFPLAVAMAQHDVPPTDVSITLGHNLRLGDGPIVPIDDAGQLDLTRIELPAEPPTFNISAEQAILASRLPEIQATLPEHTPRCVLFSDALPGNPAPWSTPEHLRRTISSFDALPRPGNPEPHHRLAPAFEIGLLLLLSVAAGLLAGRRRLVHALAFPTLAIAALALLASLFFSAQTWSPVAPVLATVAVGWLLSLRMAPFFPPAQDPITAS